MSSRNGEMNEDGVVQFTLEELVHALNDDTLRLGGVGNPFFRTTRGPQWDVADIQDVLVVDDEGRVDLPIMDHLSWAIVTAARASKALDVLLDVAVRTLDEREQEREEQAGESDEAAYVRLLASGW